MPRAASAVTDAEGRFRIAHFPERAAPNLIVDVGGFGQFVKGYLRFRIGGDKETRVAQPEVYESLPTNGILDVGTKHGDGGKVDTRFSGACSGELRPPASPTPQSPQTEVLFFKRSGKEPWRHIGLRADDITRGHTLPWKAIVCVDAEEGVVGRYIGGIGVDAVRITWRVRVIRLTDKKTFSTLLRFDPPPTRVMGDPDDPFPQLLDWLKQISTQ